MIKRLLQIVVVGIFLLNIVAGCSKQAKVDISALTASKLPKEIASRLVDASKVKTLRALIDAQIRYKGTKKSFNLVVVAKSPDWIRMEFIDPLAGPVMSIISTPDRVIYANSTGVYFYDGEDGEGAFKEITRLPWAPKELIKIFMGTLPVSVSAGAKYPQDSEDRFWVSDGKDYLSWSESEGKFTYIEMGGKKIAAKIDYSDYRDDGDLLFPAKIDVELRRPKTAINLIYKEVVLNPSLKQGVFSQVNFVSYEKYQVHKSSE